MSMELDHKDDSHPTNHRSITGGILTTLSQGFGILLAVTYATGFLCIYTFSDRFGIHDTGEDFFRVKYIHVGILFLLFPLTILAPLALALSLKRTEWKENHPPGTTPTTNLMEKITAIMNAIAPEGKKENTTKFKVRIANIVLFLNMLSVFYIFVLFVPTGFAFSKAAIFPWIFIVSFLGSPLIDFIVEKFIVPHWSAVAGFFLRWLLVLVIVGVLDGFLFFGFWRKLWIIFWGVHLFPDGAIYYLVFMFLIAFTFFLTNKRAKDAPNTRSKREMYLAALAAALMLYFLAISAFALRVYPRIPVAKGGGNFVESPRVAIQFRRVPGVSPIVETVNSVEAALSKSNSFVIIEQSPTSLFLADTADTGGPVEWQEMRELPNIVEVHRDSINEIVYTQVVITKVAF